MPRPRKGAEPKLRGVRKKTYTRKEGTVAVYWQFLVSVPGQDGRPRKEWRNAPSQRAAEEARADRKVEVKRGEAVRANKMTLAAYLAEWLPKHAVKNDLEPTTVAGYETIIN